MGLVRGTRAQVIPSGVSLAYMPKAIAYVGTSASTGLTVDRNFTIDNAGALHLVAVMDRPANTPRTTISDRVVGASWGGIRTLVASAAGSGVGKTAEEIGLQVQAALHLWGNGACRLSADTEALVPYDQAPAGVTSYDVRLTTNETGRELAPKLAEPTIEVTAGVATITASEPAALLWYSLDGSYPSVAYTGPVALPDGTGLRARASLSGAPGRKASLSA